MSWRQAEPRTSIPAAAKNDPRRVTKSFTTEDAEDTEALRGWIQWILSVLCVLRGKALRLVSNDRHLFGLERFQKTARLGQIEFLVSRFDAQEKPVAARERESRYVEHRVIRLRQAVERQHAEHGGQRCAENRALEGHRNKRRPTVQRLSADVERIRDRRHPVLQEVSGNAANQSADEHDLRQFGVVEADRFVQFLNRQR